MTVTGWMIYKYDYIMHKLMNNLRYLRCGNIFDTLPNKTDYYSIQTSINWSRV